MQLNEIIENYGYDDIGRRTMISVRNLKQLAKRDISDLPRVKAIGLISIIEREYRVELDALRDEFNVLYGGKDEEIEFDPAKVIKVVDGEDLKGGISRKLLPIIPVVVLIFIAWYFFLRNENLENLFKKGRGETSLADSVALQAKDSISKNNTTKPDAIDTLSIPSANKELDNDLTPEAKIIQELKNEQNKILKKEEKIKKEEQDKVEKSKPTLLKIEGVVSAADELPAVPDTVEDSNDVENANSSDNSMITTKTDSNESGISAVDNPDEIPAQEPDALPAQQIENNTVTPEVKKAETKPARAEKKVSRKPSPTPIKKKTTRVRLKSTSTKIVFHPKSTVWVGYTNLTNMSRKSIVLNKGQDISIETRGKKYILVAGNRNFDFYSKGRLQKLTNMPGLIYYRISNGNITPITKEEFQSLNQNTTW